MQVISAEALIDRPKSLFIGGEWRSPAEPHRLTVVDPCKREPLAEIAGAGAPDVAAAITAAHDAFLRWRRTSGAERSRLLIGFADGLQQRSEALIQLQMLNNGKPRAEAEIDLGDAMATFRYYAGLAEQLDGRQGEPVLLPDADYRGKTRFEPVGPVGMIVPWNFPLVTSAWKIAPALAAGCTVVLKTSEYTPLIELAYGDIAEAIGLPAGVLNILTGGAAAGAALTGDPRLAKLSFTGSNAVGSLVMAAAARGCVPVALELGGKSPIVVFADADIEAAVGYVMNGIFYNCGQMCSATSRLIVERSAAPAVLDRLVERTKALAVGPPFEPASRMGPLTTRPQYEKILKTFDQARADGLDCLCGGAGLGSEGFFAAPTIYADVPRENPVWREEIFGPVLAARSFETEAEAIALANDTAFGLVATVVSGDADRAERIAAEIDAGHIWINSMQVIFPEAAWGGFKASGIGRELGPWGLNAFLGVKHLTISRGGER